MTTRVVEVSVIAETKAGEPVYGLERQDFALFDAGSPQTIALFSAESPRPAETAPAPLAPNTYSNRVERLAGGLAPVTAILFDGLNTPLADQSYARRQIVSFLEQLNPGDRIALYTLGRGLSLLHDFSSDARSLIAALDRYKGDLAAGGEPGPERFNSWLDELKLNLIEYYARDRALRTIRSLVAIANHLERAPGSKSLIWVSGSFPVWIGRDAVPLPARASGGSQSFWPEIERAARALNNAGLAVYPVDARGLMAPVNYSPERATGGVEPETSSRSGFETMRILAERTGGQAFYNNNDLRRALRRAADDARSAYFLGYQPSHDEWNGKFREVRVEVRRPGVRLRHRRGYFAQPEEPAEEWYRSSVLGAAMWSPVDATRLGMTIRPRPGSDGSLDLELELDAHDFSIQPAEGIWAANLDIWLVQLGPNDRLVDSVSHAAALRFNQASFQKAMQSGSVVLMERVSRKKEAVLLRVLARDVATGALGSVSIPLDAVPARPSG